VPAYNLSKGFLGLVIGEYMPTLKQFEEWLTTSEAASRMSKTHQGVVWMLENGRLRGVRTALGWLVDPQDAARVAREHSHRGSPWGGEPEDEHWDEAEAVRLLDDTGALVAGFEVEAARIPAELRERYHARIAEAHEARDMAAYREALNGYVAAAREAHRWRARI
jgi:hypothetical protein